MNVSPQISHVSQQRVQLPRATAGDRLSTAKVFRNSWTVIAPKGVSRNPEEKRSDVIEPFQTHRPDDAGRPVIRRRWSTTASGGLASVATRQRPHVSIGLPDEIGAWGTHKKMTGSRWQRITSVHAVEAPLTAIEKSTPWLISLCFGTRGSCRKVCDRNCRRTRAHGKLSPKSERPRRLSFSCPITIP